MWFSVYKKQSVKQTNKQINRLFNLVSKASWAGTTSQYHSWTKQVIRETAYTGRLLEDSLLEPGR